ncbi:MAG: tRNA (guanine-N7-)-methyltransferase [Chthoniobacter sp.]|nr:tRNA (guanine-N7-)-methyltransferase [Chthoniobacter sp.]
MSELQGLECGVEIVPHDYFDRLRLDEHFPRVAPLEVDVGSGSGGFLIAMARRHPDRNFLGIERLLGRVRKTCEVASRLGLPNVHVLRVESAYAMEHLLPPASVRVFHVAFPDPWPKRRHWPRRLVNRVFLDAAAAALEPGGEIRFKTDDLPYFSHIASVARAHAAFREIESLAEPDYPETNFERRFRAKGAPIYCLWLVKESLPRNARAVH